MTVNEVYLLIQYIVNKSQNGYVTPDEFNRVINQAQVSYMDYLLGQFQQYQAGRPISNVQFGNNETTRQRITPFIHPATLTVNGQGVATYPSGYLQTDTMWTSNYNKIKFIQQNFLSNYINSKIAPIAGNPIYMIEKDGFKFYPNNIASAIVNYIKEPTTIVWGYTLDSNGLPVYSVGTSVNPQWQEVDMLEIISRALRMIGVNLQSTVVSQYANEITKTGQ